MIEYYLNAHQRDSALYNCGIQLVPCCLASFNSGRVLQPAI